MTASKSVVIHGHFYQPPRENPWTGRIDAEPTAAPDHDWNARITRECYTPLVSIPIGAIDDPPRIDAYNFLSFDVGPTLIEWLEKEAPDTWSAMVQGDRQSRARLGHGNAMAMPYHHVILPLSSRRDKRTEVRWGIADFRKRFGRVPEGMWLPETAADLETLDVLAEEGIAFTVLAPHQVTKPPADGRAGTVKTSGGRSIAVFAYDGALSHDVAFGPLVRDPAEWEKRILASGADVVSMATDGETFGHHHKGGDVALGTLVHHLAARRGRRIENFASALAAHPPREELTLVAPSSWSCAHGVERWRSDCGCRMTHDGKSQQRWRAPLRTAIDWLVHESGALVERAAASRGRDLWADLQAAGVRGTPPGADSGTARLLDMERYALRSLTSCGWFFDDFGGLEGRQVLRYAARAIGLAGADGPRLEAGFLERLGGATSNDPRVGTARDLYLSIVKAEAAA